MILAMVEAEELIAGLAEDRHQPRATVVKTAGGAGEEDRRPRSVHRGHAGSGGAVTGCARPIHLVGSRIQVRQIGNVPIRRPGINRNAGIRIGNNFRSPEGDRELSL